ncbi:MAG: glycosyltransferase [Ignavibacteria bacterium]|jgi:glycosyltransferase involved in cell wall biosynthesis
MQLLQINSAINTGSTGRIAEEIGETIIKAGHKSYIAASNTIRPSSSQKIKIGNKKDKYLHILATRLTDKHGFYSRRSTINFTKKIDEINPDIIHLHNIHGYYLNIEILFNYFKKINKTVVWTFHDCWPFTGHCSYFDAVDCERWKIECYECPNKKGYPASWVFDNSKKNFRKKKELFTGIEKLTIITPSNWLLKHVQNSFLRQYPSKVIHNGINLNIFQRMDNKSILSKYNFVNKRYILGVANTWDKRKGLEDFIKLRAHLYKDIKIVLVGLNEKQIKSLPDGIIGIRRTENIDELVHLYSSAFVFINPTYVDNFPTTNIEALACGTPVITYNTGGSPEAIDENTGFVVEKGDINGTVKAIENIAGRGKEFYSNKCRERAKKYFNKNDRYREYLNLYKELCSRN